MSDIYTIAKSGLLAYKEGLATTGQNIANVGNDAYSRREASISELKSGSPDVLQVSENLSFGVKVDGITRAFDQFIETQLHDAKSNFSFSESQTNVLNQLESIIRPGENAVSQKINGFFASLSSLTQDPSDTASRFSVLEAAKSVVNSIKNAANGIIDLRQFVDANVKANVDDANLIINQISNIQKELLGNSSPNAARNDLLDQRDNLLQKLSEIVEIKVRYKPRGEIDVLAGTDGQGQVLISGFEKKEFLLRAENSSNKIFVVVPGSNDGVKVQVASGKIAGNLASDHTLVATKAALDDLAKKFVAEINEIHTTGVDLNGDIGQELFKLNSIDIVKISDLGSSTQLAVSNISNVNIESPLNIIYVAENDNWQIKTRDNALLATFKGSYNLNGLDIYISGTPTIGDAFEVNFSDNLAQNLSLNITDARQLAAASYYLAEKNADNKSSVNLTIDTFIIEDESSVPSLNGLLVFENDSANALTFRNTGVLGVLNEVDNLNGLTALLSQARIQFGADVEDLNASSQLKLTLGATTHTFSLSTHFDDIESLGDLAELLNSGIIKSDILSDGEAMTFNDLGLRGAANANSLNIASAYMPNSSNYSELKSGALAGNNGIIHAGNFSSSDIQILTREGVQISGRPLTQEQIANFMTVENGFSADAKYTAAYIDVEGDTSYMGAHVSRKTTTGNFILSLTALGELATENSNLLTGLTADMPLERRGMSSEIKFKTQAGHDISFKSEKGMMAGQIASSLNSKVAEFGLKAFAHNNVELYDLPSETISFSLKGDNSSAIQISADLSNGNAQSLVDMVNNHSGETGILAFRTGNASVIFKKTDGNDISLENVTISNDEDFKIRQINETGEVVNSPENDNPTVLSSGKFAIVGGQIDIKSSAEFNLIINDVVTNSQASAFEAGFVQRNYLLDSNKTQFEFTALTNVDGAYESADGLLPVAPTNAYLFEIVGDNPNEKLMADVHGSLRDGLTKSDIAMGIAKDLRDSAPKASFFGNSFTLDDGFPPTGTSLDFVLGEQKYRAVLNFVPEYTIVGDRVKIGNETLTKTDALKRLVSEVKFNISGPENERINVGFSEVNSSGFRLFAMASDGVLSGHALRLSDDNSVFELNAFHIDNGVLGSSQTVIYGNEFDTTQGDQSNIAQLVIGDTVVNIDFASANVTAAVTSGVTYSLEGTGTNRARLKVEIDQTVAEQDIRLRATENSKNFGVTTAGTQLIIENEGFSLSNYANSRVDTSAKVESLASEVISISNLGGEDLIVISTGNTKPKLLGSAEAYNKALKAREITAKFDPVDPNIVELFDSKSGDYLGTRVLSSSNNFFFRDFDWQFDGAANTNDSFKLSINSSRSDDASNLIKILNLADYSEKSGRGGYSNLYNEIVTATGYNSRAAEQSLETSQIIHDVALDRKSMFSGVDLDTEAARLLEQQQAYQALAKVLSTAKELVDTLLRAF